MSAWPGEKKRHPRGYRTGRYRVYWEMGDRVIGACSHSHASMAGAERCAARGNPNGKGGVPRISLMVSTRRTHS